MTAEDTNQKLDRVAFVAGGISTLDDLFMVMNYARVCCE